LGTRRKRTVGRFIGAAHVLWPFDTVDVVGVDSAPPLVFPRPPERIVAVEQVNTAATTRVTVPMNDARYTISASAGDERGTPLINALNGTRDCREQFIFAFPSGRKFAREQSASTRSFLGRFSDRVILYTSLH